MSNLGHGGNVHAYVTPELELRLTGPVNVVAAYARSERLQKLAAGRGAWRRIQSTFYDTASGYFAEKGVVLAVQNEEGAFWRCFSYTDPSSVHAREERIIERCDADAFNVDDIERIAPQWGEWPSMIDGPILSNRQLEADQWRGVIYYDGAVIEIAAEVGRILSHDLEGPRPHSPYADIRFSILQGPYSAIFKIVRHAITENAGQLKLTLDQPGEGSILLRRTVTKAAKVAIGEASSAADVLADGIAASAWRLVRLTPYLLEKDGPEAARHARVALRRFRAFEKTFRKSVSSIELRELAARARTYARVIGAARDWDVFIADTLPAAVEHEETPATNYELLVNGRTLESQTPIEEGVAQIKARAEQFQANAWRDVISIVNANEFSIFLLDMLEGAYCPKWREEADARLLGPAGVFASMALDKGVSRAERVADQIDLNDLETLHALRLELKKFRYAAQIFRGALS